MVGWSWRDRRLPRYPNHSPTMTNQQQIFDAIPHRDPFLFVDEIVRWDENEIVCKKMFSGKEFFFAGHYPHYPLTPGVILCEAAMQVGAIFLSKFFKETHDVSESIVESEYRRSVPVDGRMNDVKFRQMVHPGDEVLMQVTLTEQMQDVFFMKAKVTTSGKIAVTFNFACKMVLEATDVTTTFPAQADSANQSSSRKSC